MKTKLPTVRFREAVRRERQGHLIFVTTELIKQTEEDIFVAGVAQMARSLHRKVNKE